LSSRTSLKTFKQYKGPSKARHDHSQSEFVSEEKVKQGSDARKISKKIDLANANPAMQATAYQN